MRIGILGGAITIEKENQDWSIEDTVFYTVQKASKDVNMEIGEIDTIVQAGDDVLDGLAIQHCQTIEAAGAFMKEESKVERDGAWGAHYMMARLLSGKFKTGMVIGFSKGTQCGLSAFSGMCADPFYLRPVGTDADSIAAIQAQYYSQRTGATKEDFARVASKNRKNGKGNPRIMAGESGDFEVQDVLKSPCSADPIYELSSGRVGDGCVVLIMATEEYVKEKKLSVPYITGVGFYSDAYYPTYRDLSRLITVKASADTAFKMAGGSIRDIHVAEVHECYAHQELMLYEALGLCPEGNAEKLLKDGDTQKNGKIPVNPEGGILCGNILYGSGLSRVWEASLQVAGKAGVSQVKGVRRALAHAQAGLAMQSNIVYIVEG